MLKKAPDLKDTLQSEEDRKVNIRLVLENVNRMVRLTVALRADQQRIEHNDLQDQKCNGPHAASFQEQLRAVFPSTAIMKACNFESAAAPDKVLCRLVPRISAPRFRVLK